MSKIKKACFFKKRVKYYIFLNYNNYYWLDIPR